MVLISIILGSLKVFNVVSISFRDFHDFCQNLKTKFPQKS